MDVLRTVRACIERYRMLEPEETLLVAVSGGPDSLCMLHVLHRLSQERALSLHVAHLNHLLRGPEADADAAFVQRLAAEWGLPVTVESFDVAGLAARRKLAIEEAARLARYTFLRNAARRVGARRIAVGHSADDQVETVLMHFLRGSGLAGLRGMQYVSGLDELRLGDPEQASSAVEGLTLLRPLLDVPREAIEAYCATHGLQPRWDRSNLDTTFYRNRLRHELLPFLETFNPAIREVVLRTSAVISADYECLRQQAAQAWSRVVSAQEPQAITFDLSGWRELPVALQRSTLREAIHRLRRSLRNINWVHVDNAVQVLSQGRTGMRACLPGRLEVRVDYDHFTVADRGYSPGLPDLPFLQEAELPLRVPGRTPLPSTRWVLAARVVNLCDVEDVTLRPISSWHAYLDGDVAGRQLHLRTRRTGDRFWPLGLGDKPTTVNSFMTNAKVPRSWRDSIPLLVSSRQVLWVAGWRIDERAKVTEDTQRVLVLGFEPTGGTPGRVTG
jgi:tRNA(Ile)-lysidine synthase